MSQANPYRQLVESTLESTRNRLFYEQTITELIRLTILMAGYVCLFIVLDHWILPAGSNRAFRWFAFCGLAALLIWIVRSRILPLFLYRINPLYAAKAIEDEAPQLKNSLVNLVSLQDEKERLNLLSATNESESDPPESGTKKNESDTESSSANAAGRKSGPKRTVPDGVLTLLEYFAARDLKRIELESVADRASVLKASYLLTGFFAFFCLYCILSPKSLWTSMARFFCPWGNIASATRVQIPEVEPGNTVLFVGQKLNIYASIKGLRKSEPVSVRINSRSGAKRDVSVALTVPEGDYRYHAQVPAGSNGAQEDFTYCVEAGDKRSPVFEVRVIPVPTLSIERIEYKPPTYTGLKSTVQKDGGDIRGLEGTIVQLFARANCPIKEAYLKTESSTPAHWKMKPDGNRVSLEFPLKWNDKRNEPELEGYRLSFVDRDGQTNKNPSLYRVEITRDLAPVISCNASDSTPLPANGRWKIKVQANDPDFGLKSVELQFEKMVLDQNGQETRRQKRIPLLANGLSAPVKGQSAAIAAASKRFPLDYSASYSFSVRDWKLKEGETVLWRIVAEDNRQPKANRTVSGDMRIVVGAAQGNPKQEQEVKTPEKPDKNDKGNKAETESQKKDTDSGKQPQEKDKQNPETGDNPEPSPLGQEQSEKEQSGQQQDNSESGEQNGEQQSGDQNSGNQGGEQNGEQQSEDQNSGNQGGEQNGEQQSGDQNSGNQGGEQNGEQNSGNQGGEQNGDQQSGKQNSGNQGGEQNGEQNSGNQGGEQNGDQQSGSASESIDPVANPGDAIEEILAHESQQKNGQMGQREQNNQSGKPNPGDSQENNKSKDGEKGNGEKSDDNTNSGKSSAADGQIPKTTDRSGSGVKSEDQSQDAPVSTQPQKNNPFAGEETENRGETPEGLNTDNIQKNEKNEPGSQPNSGKPTDQNPDELTPNSERPSDKPDSGEKERKPGDESGADSQNEQLDPENADNSQQGASSQGSKKSDEPNTQPGPNQQSDSRGEKNQGQSGANSQKSDAHTNNEEINQTPGEQPEAGTNAPKDSGSEQPSPKGDPAPFNNTDRKSNPKDPNNRQKGAGEEGGGEDSEKSGKSNDGAQTPSETGSLGGNDGNEGTGQNPGDKVKSDGAPGKTDPNRRAGPGQESGAKDSSPDSQTTDGSPSDPNAAHGSESGNSSEGGMGAEPTASSEQGIADSRLGGGLPGTGQGTATGNPPLTAEEEANLDYSRKQTVLALAHLKDQLQKGDSDLLERLGWTEQQAREFIERWEKMFSQAKSGRDEKAAERLNQTLKGLGLRPKNVRSTGAEKNRDSSSPTIRDSSQSEPPDEWSDAFRAFTRSLGTE